jgi:nucleotide-binding universal stress UspA family protein
MDSRLESALAWPGVYDVSFVPERDTGIKEAVIRLIENSAKQLYDAGCKVETHVLNGDPKRELLHHAEAWEADSIFIGARGQQHGQRLTLGTMASAVATRAHCSVEIVRPG